MANVVPTATLNDILDDRYNGTTITCHLTNTLTYTTTTTYANVTANQVLTTTAAGIAASAGSMGPVAFELTNNTGSTVNYDGIAFTIGAATIEVANNDESGSIPDTQSKTFNLTLPITVTP